MPGELKQAMRRGEIWHSSPPLLFVMEIAPNTVYWAAVTCRKETVPASGTEGNMI